MQCEGQINASCVFARLPVDMPVTLSLICCSHLRREGNQNSTGKHMNKCHIISSVFGGGASDRILYRGLVNDHHPTQMGQRKEAIRMLMMMIDDD